MASILDDALAPPHNRVVAVGAAFRRHYGLCAELDPSNASFDATGSNREVPRRQGEDEEESDSPPQGSVESCGTIVGPIAKGGGAPRRHERSSPSNRPGRAAKQRLRGAPQGRPITDGHGRESEESPGSDLDYGPASYCVPGSAIHGAIARRTRCRGSDPRL